MHEKICKILAKYNTFQIAVHNWKIYISCDKMLRLVKVVARLLRANQIGPISAFQYQMKLLNQGSTNICIGTGLARGSATVMR